MSSPPFDLVDIVMRAGAGAGKTTELTQRVLRLADAFKKETQYPHFVVTTFTRKATQELKERLLKKAMESKDNALIDFVQSPSHLHISTIHGVLSLFLSKYGSAMGLSPRLTMVSERKNQQTLKRMIRDLCSEDDQFNTDFQSLLENAEFKELIEALKSAFQIQQQFTTARPASTFDFQKVLAEKVAEIQVKMEEFVQLAGAAEDKWLELREAYSRALATLKTSDKPVEILCGLSENLPSVRAGKKIPESWSDLRKEIKDQLDELDENNVQPAFWEQHQLLCDQFSRCSGKLNDKWLAEKLKTGEVTMSDLESLTLSLVRQFPQAAESFSKTWDYWLIDEYQDTSPAQVEILRALMGDRKSFVVGDPQQSIYLFRGARAEVFEDREKVVSTSGGILFPKMMNYRSEPELLLFFNFVFTQIGRQFRAMEPKAPPVTDRHHVVDVVVVPKLEDDLIDPQNEAVLARIQELMADGLPAEKICVLGRTHSDLEAIALRAREVGVPVQLHTSGGLFDRREIMDALSLLKFLCNPHDNPNLLQLIRSPFFKVSDQAIYEGMSKVKGSYWLNFSEKASDDSIFALLKNLLTKANKLGVGSVWSEQLIESGFFIYAQKLDPTGRREANLWKLIHLIQAEEKRPGFSYLEFIQNQEAAQDTEDGNQSEGVPVMEPQRVHLMTVHASKGLEFHHVILPYMGSRPNHSKTEFFLSDDNEGIWTLSILDPETGGKKASLMGKRFLEVLVEREKKEVERQLYVALTRAEKGVTLIFDEKADKNSWAARLPLKLEDGTHQEKDFSYRVRRELLQPQMQKADQAIQTSWRPKYEVPESESGHSWKLRSVTEILEGAQAKAAASEAIAKRDMADIEKALTGVAVHRLFENLKYQWLRDPGFDWKSSLKYLPEKTQKALTYLMEDQNGLWQEVIQNGEVEFGFSAKLGQSLVQGQIDLWGRDKKGQVWIVDYKTGSPQHSEKAFQQLEIYAWALAKMKKLDPQERIQLSVIYPFSETTLVKTGQLRVHDTENLIQV